MKAAGRSQMAFGALPAFAGMAARAVMTDSGADVFNLCELTSARDD
jgi:hypothetical protein